VVLGMSKIKFDKCIQTQEFLNVTKGYARESFEVEVRYDPLLGNTSVYNRQLKGKLKVIFGTADEELITQMVHQSAGNCILCNGKIQSSTPKYPEALLKSGRIQIGEATLFPNLFPIGKYHAVISISKAHFLRLHEFTPQLLTDAFLSARDFARNVYKIDSLPLYITLNANYLFPSGSSLVHPHLQLLITSIPYSFHKRLIDACLCYYQRNSSNYFNDLIFEEKKRDERYISQYGRWHFAASYAPSGSNEIIAIHESEADISGLTETDMRDIASGISRILSYYEKMGFLSFNFTLFSSRNSKGFNCFFKMMTRQNLYPNYRNDDYYLQKILHSELMIVLPEELASGIRESSKS
jgi:galactose-1-phosphate uridylyltransferase